MPPKRPDQVILDQDLFIIIRITENQMCEAGFFSFTDPPLCGILYNRGLMISVAFAGESAYRKDE